MRKGSSKSDGAIIERLERIKTLVERTIQLARDRKRRIPLPKQHRTSPRGDDTVDFAIPLRPFIKKYGRGMSGPKKFALLLARITGGDLSKNVSLDEIQRQWNKMTAKGLLGMKFNRFYSSAAKENDWVNTEKNGLYHLRPSWTEVLREER